MRRLILGAGVAAILALPASALAQDKAFIGAFVGGTIANQGGGAFGGTVGFKTGEKMTIFGEFGRMTNLLPGSVADQIQRASALAAGALGGSASSLAKTRTNYGLIGARMKTNFISGLDTFLELGVGAGQVSTDLHVLLRGSETAQGEITHLVSTPFTQSKGTKPVMAVGGGIVLPITGRAAVEVGVGYMRVFTDSPALNAARVYGSYRIGF